VRIIGVIMVLAAVGLGIVAVIFLRNYLEEQETERAAQRAVVPIQKVVVARKALDFGDVLSETALVEVDWPQGSLPKGVFGSTAEVLGDGERRVVLRRIEVNEPILKNKISGFGGRAALSTIMPKGARAVTIRVNDIAGVAGFVLPGDRVDILITQGAGDDRSTDILMQNVKVLAIDQLTGTTAEKPVVAKAVTFEVSPEQAQQLILAQRVGALTLSLRNEANLEQLELPSLDARQLLEREAPAVVVEREEPKTVPEAERESPATVAAREAAAEAKAAAEAARLALEQAKTQAEQAVAKAEADRARAAAEEAAKRAEEEERRAKEEEEKRIAMQKAADDKDLSNKLSDQTRALTISVNEIVGVAGFVLPGDHVDVILIMSGPNAAKVVKGAKGSASGSGDGKAKATADDTTASYLLQNVKVLAIDQRVEGTDNEPKIVNAVTVSVTPLDAQKLALAQTVGKLVLALRGTENALEMALSTITVADLLRDTRVAAKVKKPTRIAKPRRGGPRRLPRFVNVNIIRALKPSQQRVVREGATTQAPRN
jgi:pilus assembly protein CpaB